MTTAQLTARSLSALLGHWQSEGAAYRALADRIRLLVLDGRILVGSRLPAERELAARLELSRSTVAAAYRALREAGYLTSVQGSGSMTRIPADTHDGERGGGPRGAFVASTASRDTAVDSDRPLLNFTQAALPASAGVSEAIQQAAADVAPLLDTLGFELHGLPALREAIADRYTERGLPTEPGEIMVTGGALSALSLITRAFVARGDRVVVETPTYPHAADTLLAAGARLVPVGVSVDDGWNEDALLDALAQSAPALAYVMPDFHNPTGASMTPGFRRRLVAAAAATRTVLVADETTAELDIDRPAVAGDPYMPLAAYGDAVLIGSTSKTFWGGLRIGWIRAERAVIRRLLAARASVDIGTPVFEQLVATSLVRRTAELLPARQRQLGDGRDVLYSALEQRLPEWRRPPLAGGLCAWVNVGRPISSQLVLAARTHGVLFTAGPRFGTDGAFERFLRLPINYSPGDTRRAIEVLQRSWAELAGRPFGADLPEFADLV
ncbi:PLP-dependent aminotransferase family protein [Subtercola sp. Z020]|uniref:MocR-like transcription factor YczR n=1 Tax=Subtercola sp. Z020 TaxID=2080582 RepID=UPI000CE7941D|nr:PLP-dependent aminotransferase family protein [Subtercola sp. Z020]PPF89493.1 PLP-dependent aminotransferase family protein [Subtercola sp. Z020]